MDAGQSHTAWGGWKMTAPALEVLPLRSFRGEADADRQHHAAGRAQQIGQARAVTITQAGEFTATQGLLQTAFVRQAGRATRDIQQCGISRQATGILFPQDHHLAACAFAPDIAAACAAVSAASFFSKPNIEIVSAERVFVFAVQPRLVSIHHAARRVDSGIAGLADVSASPPIASLPSCAAAYTRIDAAFAGTGRRNRGESTE